MMLETILKSIPLFSGLTIKDIKCQKLAGLTNNNYLVTTPKQEYILRIPRESTNEFINRENESHNAKMAEELGIAPKNLWREASGVSLTAYLENTTAPTLNNPTTFENIAKTLAALHGSNVVFKDTLDNNKIAETLKQYFKLCSNEQQKLLKADYIESLSILGSSLNERPTVPSHIDLVLENILAQGEKIWFIDWEYSAMASPFWDIAIICNSGKFDSVKAETFIKMTLQNFHKKDLAILEQYRFITKTVSDCWQSAFQKLPK